MSDGNGGVNFLAGLFTGAALGAIGALLFAPRSGRELRESILDEAKRMQERAQTEARHIKERGEEVYSRTKEGVAETTETAKKAAGGVKEALLHK